MAASYSRTLTVTSSSSLLGSTQANYPALVYINDTTLKTVGNGGHVQNASGYDIQFFSDSAFSTKLDWEMEFYDGTNGIVAAWVRVPSCALSTLFYVTYGDSGISTFQGNINGTWDSHFIAVWHLSDNAASTAVVNSTATASTNGAAQANTNTLSTSGEIAQALTFNGSSDFVQVSQNGNFNLAVQAFTLQAWGLDDSSAAAIDASGYHRAVAWYNGTTMIQMGLGINPGATNRVLYVQNAAIQTSAAQASTGNVPTGFNAFAASFNGVATYHVYVGGTNLDGGTTSEDITIQTGDSTHLFIGQRGDGARYWNGKLDEVRISDVDRSADWIKADYYQTPGSAFLTIGSETPIGAGRPNRLPLLGVG